ncbi:fzo-like conserved region domain-containing protein [Phthorimaea operculella]|nr:fzo-like conserved region domain-containing protein [Phthorimaea operculella]
MVSRFALGALTSQGTMGGLLLSGLRAPRARAPQRGGVEHGVALRTHRRAPWGLLLSGLVQGPRARAHPTAGHHGALLSLGLVHYYTTLHTGTDYTTPTHYTSLTSHYTTTLHYCCLAHYTTTLLHYTVLTTLHPLHYYTLTALHHWLHYCCQACYTTTLLHYTTADYRPHALLHSAHSTAALLSHFALAALYTHTAPLAALLLSGLLHYYTTALHCVDYTASTRHYPHYSHYTTNWLLSGLLHCTHYCTTLTILLLQLLKTVGWRIVAVTGVVYGALYMYERLTWTAKQQERVFKKQYVAHASKKLRLIVDLTSANCSHQVQQELSTMFARLCRLIDEATTEMDEEQSGVREAIAMLEHAAASAKKLRNKANYLHHELELFDDAFLKPN